MGAEPGRETTRQPHPSYCPFHACQRVVCRCGILPDPPGREATPVDECHHEFEGTQTCHWCGATVGREPSRSTAEDDQRG